MTKSISILISSFNTKKSYVNDCIKSILKQTYLNNCIFEIIWINDGSTEENSLDLETSLEQFKLHKNINLIYKKFPINKGLVDALNTGLKLCTNELIFRMDSDDIMFPYRIEKQVNFMNNNPHVMICGTYIIPFNDNINIDNRVVKHQTIIKWKDFLKSPLNWFMNHPTLVYRKKAIEQIGGYNDNQLVKYSSMEDFELELRFMKYYGAVYNLPEPLLLYRIHEEQITQKYKNIEKTNIRRQIIKNLTE